METKGIKFEAKRKEFIDATETVINEEEWADCKYRTKEWEDTVEIYKWEHDHEFKYYKIIYNMK